MNESASEVVNQDEGDLRQDEVDLHSEQERRKAERRARVKERHPRIGWLLLALAGAQAYKEERRDRSGRGGL